MRGAGLAVSGFGASGLALTAIGVLSVAMGMWSPARAQARAASPAWVSGAVGWRGHRL
ncbi:hypothetical protein ACO2Q3_25395 [Caulobacter sp. KR2-114]|uniref:hypothetical protein n=1 Tax=Caulobacter sp. KR2-114 TaxID=3400912 RepID=UPI003C0900AF